jgi:hypothetical protein
LALLDSYCTAAEYRSRVNMLDTASDVEILAQLTSTSRFLERELRVAPGYFNATAVGQIRYFEPVLIANRLFRLVDEDGFQHCLTAIANDGVAVDTDGDGVYNYTVDPTGESWVVARPYNAPDLGRPWESLEILSLSAATFSYWPNYPRGVRITGTWGWTAVPGTIKELVVKMTRDIRDSEEAGAAGSLAGVALKTDTWRLWLSAKSVYGHSPLVVA